MPFSLYLRVRFFERNVFLKFMKMKKFISTIFVAVVSVAFVVSCGPADQEFTEERFVDNIYTVNKHAVIPEFTDTSYMVSNMAQHPLQTGDRVRMILRYYFDAGSSKMPQWSIYHIGEIIPVRPIVAKGEVDTLEYATPFVGLDYYELMERYYNPVWIWKNRQNINIIYKGVEDEAQFAMAVRGISGDFLELELYAKAKSIAEVKTTKLLTFDLNGVESLVAPEEQSLVKDIDSLRTKIYLKRLDEKGVVSEASIIGGKFRNPFKK